MTIRIQYSKSAKTFTHIDEAEKSTEITALSIEPTLKDVIDRAKVMGLKVKKTAVEL